MKMGKGGLAWAAILGMLPFVSFFDMRVDLWHAQTHWLELGILLAWFISLSLGRKIRIPTPILMWASVLSISTFYFWHNIVAETKQYPYSLLMPVMHWLIILLGITSLLSLDSLDIQLISRWIAISGSIMIGYGILQYLGMDQFFNNLDTSLGRNKVMVGTIGNPSHFAAYLAIIIPILLSQPKQFMRFMAIPAIILILISKSAAAQASLLVGLGWLWRKDLRSILIMLAVIGLSLLLIHLNPTNLNSHGRIAAWKAFLEMFQKKPITGNGLGFIYQFSKTIPQGSPIFQWRHAHCEPIQILVEQGVLGLSLCAWTFFSWAKRVWQAESTLLLSALSASFLAFLTNSLLNFPAHLAMTGGIALFCFGSSIVLSEREIA